MRGGILGKIIWVDLAKEKFEVTQPGEELYQRYLGGYGIGVKLIYQAQPAGINPLDSDTILGFATGPLTGTPAPSPKSSEYKIFGVN